MKTPRPPWLLVLAVLALHLLLAHEVQRIADGWVHDGPPPMPARMQVAFVRELALQEPTPAPASPPVPPPPAAPPTPPVTPPRPQAEDGTPAVAAQAASAPQTPPGPVPSASEPAEAAASAPQTAPPVAQAASAPAGEEPGAEWPLSTRLSYELRGNYRGPVYGQAQVEWLRRGSDYQVNLDVSVGPSFAPLITRRMSSQGQVTPDGITPQRYDEETRFIVGDTRRSTVFFLGAEVQLAQGVREPLPRAAQDSASQFVQLTWLFRTGRELLEPGRVVTFPVVLPRRQYAEWPYEIVDNESVETAMGWVPAWHLRPRATASSGDLTAEVWLAPGLQFLPVRLIIRQDAETYVDLMLKGLPEQAAPESASSTPRRSSP
ncbi:DUF3108 domain-containing protein [Pelomonas cellulosilytica]|uniref:DUF3108 domain-containing protein n=1 Tax=Pelomonas cellulosilytica TaxID=2906762 RepID=A0ABS8XZQ4_9BURK|nr:DUF3108 domain-containing protein [Pelomonas sp. P8]MCE4558079.1 DUF3108 domain-containing protein [Pelomonas sp. P8]